MHTLTHKILQGLIHGELRGWIWTVPHHIKKHDYKPPSKPTTDLKMEPTTIPIPKTPQKRPPPKIVIPEPASPQQITRRSLTYKARSLDILLATQAVPKQHLAILAEKRRLNLFETAIKTETTAQTTPPGYILVIID